MTIISVLCAVAAAILWWPASTRTRLLDVVGSEAVPHRAHAIARALRQRALATRRWSRQREAAVDFLDGLAAELRSGRPPITAITMTGNESCPHALAAARVGGDVADALRADGAAIPVLRALAACWQVSESSGSGLASSVVRLAEAERAAHDLRVELRASLAAPRASSRTMMLLPVLGILMGIGLGVDPLGWLVGSGWGLACLAAGVTLTGLGLLWTSRIAQRAERLL